MLREGSGLAQRVWPELVIARRPPMAPRRWRRSRSTAPMSSSSTSRCRA
jgi:hypothetical protein